MSPKSKTARKKKRRRDGRPPAPAGKAPDSGLIAEAKRRHQAGDLRRAEEAYRRVLEGDPENAEALHFLGVLMYQEGQREPAIELITKAIEKNPRAARYHFNLGMVHRDQGRLDEALVCFRKAVELQPDHQDAKLEFLSLLTSHVPAAYDPEYEKILRNYFKSGGVYYQQVAKAAAAHLRHKYHFKSRTEEGGRLDAGLAEDLSRDALFIAFLELTVNVDPDLEDGLTGLRRDLLLAYFGAQRIPQWAQRLMSALAQQCFNNEFVFFVEADEEERLAALEEAVEGKLNSGGGVSAELERHLLLLGMYGPLHRLSVAERVRAVPLDTWSRPLRPLIRRTLLEPLEEADLKGEIESLGDIEDATSRAVRAQYEENPYPRWVGLPPAKKTSYAFHLKWNFPHLVMPAFMQGPIRMLVAGCGTGQEPLSYALLYEGVDILAVDLSKRSLAYAKRMARNLGVENVRFLQGDILDLTKLDRRFHVISSAGVLHHMERPEEGWDVLLSLLAPDGLMKIGLYSETARRHIVSMRKEIQRLGIEPRAEGIRRLRRGIMDSKEDPVSSSLLRFPDFFSMSNCRDLLFHVKEHRFAFPQIERILEERGLSFVGMNVPSGGVRRLYKKHFPRDPEMTSLNSWRWFEELFPDTFRGMYVFWCQKRGTA